MVLKESYNNRKIMIVGVISKGWVYRLNGLLFLLRIPSSLNRITALAGFVVFKFNPQGKAWFRIFSLRNLGQTVKP